MVETTSAPDQRNIMTRTNASTTVDPASVRRSNLSVDRQTIRVLRRRGIILAVILGVVTVLLVFAGLLCVLSQGASREVDVISGHVQAISVGETAFAEIVARLVVLPWGQRWFRTGPDVQRDHQTEGGTYSYLIQDTLSPPTVTDPILGESLSGPRQADLLVRATHDRSTVVMFWRLTVPRNSIDSIGRVVPLFFTHWDPSVAVTPPAANSLSEQVTRWIETRSRNRGEFEAMRPGLAATEGAGAVADLLGVRNPGLRDEVTPLAGGSGRPNPWYLGQARPGVPLTVPLPPPVPTSIPLPGPGWPGWQAPPAPSPSPSTSLPAGPNPVGQSYLSGINNRKQLLDQLIRSLETAVSTPATAAGAAQVRALLDEARSSLIELATLFPRDPEPAATPEQKAAFDRSWDVIRSIQSLPSDVLGRTR